jgi:hypothetical protein
MFGASGAATLRAPTQRVSAARGRAVVATVAGDSKKILMMGAPLPRVARAAAGAHAAARGASGAHARLQAWWHRPTMREAAREARAR